jgi:DNA-binding XRE family transcriptional regulator
MDDEQDSEPVNKGGRPTLYRPEYVELAAKLCSTVGATDREVAEFIGVTESTIYKWKLEHPEFSESLKLSKDVSDSRVVKSLYRRALGYSHDAVKISVNAQGMETITPYVEHYPPDTTAAIFWLKNRQSQEWRDKTDHEHTGKDGKDLVPDLSNPETLKDVARVNDKRVQELRRLNQPAPAPVPESPPPVNGDGKR